MLERLKEQVCEANKELDRQGVVKYTWGNVSAVDRASGMMIIKPSGVGYDTLKPDDMTVVELETGCIVEGRYRPSSDTPTHLALYRSFPQLGGIAHTHSVNAVSFAQAGKPIPALGTTHADNFYGTVPCTRELTKAEVENEYESNTGKVIVETIRELQYDPLATPGILVRNHGPFTWGNNADEAVYNAVCLEVIAEMALKTLILNADPSMAQYVLDKHYRRKHGPDAYYGQR